MEVGNSIFHVVSDDDDDDWSKIPNQDQIEPKPNRFGKFGYQNPLHSTKINQIRQEDRHNYLGGRILRILLLLLDYHKS